MIYSHFSDRLWLVLVLTHPQLLIEENLQRVSDAQGGMARFVELYIGKGECMYFFVFVSY